MGQPWYFPRELEFVSQWSGWSCRAHMLWSLAGPWPRSSPRTLPSGSGSDVIADHLILASSESGLGTKQRNQLQSMQGLGVCICPGCSSGNFSHDVFLVFRVDRHVGSIWRPGSRSGRLHVIRAAAGLGVQPASGLLCSFMGQPMRVVPCALSLAASRAVLRTAHGNGTFMMHHCKL